MTVPWLDAVLLQSGVTPSVVEVWDHASAALTVTHESEHEAAPRGSNTNANTNTNTNTNTGATSGDNGGVVLSTSVLRPAIYDTSALLRFGEMTPGTTLVTRAPFGPPAPPGPALLSVNSKRDTGGKDGTGEDSPAGRGGLPVEQAEQTERTERAASVEASIEHGGTSGGVSGVLLAQAFAIGGAPLLQRHPLVHSLASSHRTTPLAVLLKWTMQRGWGGATVSVLEWAEEGEGIGRGGGASTITAAGSSGSGVNGNGGADGDRNGSGNGNGDGDGVGGGIGGVSGGGSDGGSHRGGGIGGGCCAWSRGEGRALRTLVKALSLIPHWNFEEEEVVLEAIDALVYRTYADARAVLIAGHHRRQQAEEEGARQVQRQAASRGGGGGGGGRPVGRYKEEL